MQDKYGYSDYQSFDSSVDYHYKAQKYQFKCEQLGGAKMTVEKAIEIILNPGFMARLPGKKKEATTVLRNVDRFIKVKGSWINGQKNTINTTQDPNRRNEIIIYTINKIDKDINETENYIGALNKLGLSTEVGTMSAFLTHLNNEKTYMQQLSAPPVANQLVVPQ